MKRESAGILAVFAFAGFWEGSAWADVVPQSDYCVRTNEARRGAVINYAVVENPLENFEILHARQRFEQVQNMGVVVTNGTFFDPGAGVAIAKILTMRGSYAYGDRDKNDKEKPDRTMRRGGRFIDLDQRWGVGVRKDDGLLEVVQEKKADSPRLKTYLGGGGILLKDGKFAADENWQDRKTHPLPSGPSFPDDYRTRFVGRTALGVTKDKTKLLVVGVRPPGTNISGLAGIMKDLGAHDAVFYDGGGATAFAAGPLGGPRTVVVHPPDPSENLNPTHIVIRRCR